MDPKECLRQADQMISDGDYVSARIRLAEYWRWRAKQGFEPIEVAGTGKRGDVFARECKRRLDSALNVKPIEYTINIGGVHGYSQETGFGSLEMAHLWLLDRSELTRDHADDIWCEDTIGNSWDLVEEDGLYRWKPADVINDQYPIVELPPSGREI